MCVAFPFDRVCLCVCVCLCLLACLFAWRSYFSVHVLFAFVFARFRVCFFIALITCLFVFDFSCVSACLFDCEVV